MCVRACMRVFWPIVVVHALEVRIGKLNEFEFFIDAAKQHFVILAIL